MDTPNSQKRSPRNSAKSEKKTTDVGDAPAKPRRAPSTGDEDYLDHSPDLVARVHVAREAAQREMEAFGDPSEYDITILHGQKKEDPQEISQTSLGFDPGENSDAGETN